MKGRLLRAVAITLPVLLGGCRDNTGPLVCTLSSKSSVSVLVRDDVTGEPIASGATLVLRDEAFVDSASYPDEPYYDALPLTTPNAYDRAGVYSVTVRRAGYADWQREGVTVTKGRCHIRSVALTVRLTPVSLVSASRHD